MIKIINYTILITIISLFSLVGGNNLSAVTKNKKCNCTSVKIIKNEKYLCKISPDGKCICKKAPTGSTLKKSTTHKSNAVKNNQNKKPVVKNTVKKQQAKKTTTKKTSAKKPVKNNAKSQANSPVKDKAITPVVVAPMINDVVKADKNSSPAEQTKPVTTQNPVAPSNDVNIPLDEETSQYVPYSTQREEKSADMEMSEDINQNPKDANIKDLQKERKPTDTATNPKDKSLTDNATKEIYPNAGRNNLDLDVNIEKEKIIEDTPTPIIENAMQNDQNTLDTMIDEDLENEATKDNAEIQGISSTNSYIDEEDGVLMSKLVDNGASKAKSNQELDDEIAVNEAITSNDEIRDQLQNKDFKDLQNDNKEINNIKQLEPTGPKTDSDAHTDEKDEEEFIGKR